MRLISLKIPASVKNVVADDNGISERVWNNLNLSWIDLHYNNLGDYQYSTVSDHTSKHDMSDIMPESCQTKEYFFAYVRN